MNDYEQKFHNALAEIEQAGVKQHIRIESELERLKALGFEPRPFLYWASPLTNVAVFVLVTLVVASVQAGVTVILGENFCLPNIFGPAALAAVPLTLLTVALRLFQRRAYNLSKWEDL